MIEDTQTGIPGTEPEKYEIVMDSGKTHTVLLSDSDAEAIRKAMEEADPKGAVTVIVGGVFLTLKKSAIESFRLIPA